MAITYSLAPNPKWYFADLTGKPLGGGYIAAFSTLNPTQMKLIFQDQSGILPWPTVTIPNRGTTLGIQIDENGTKGPFYFKFDSLNPSDTYFLEIYDSNGVLQWTIFNFFPPSGGGAVVNTAINIDNILVNNVFWRHDVDTPGVLFTRLAPGINTGLTVTTTLSPQMYAPDINFIKNNMSATDQIQYIPFAPGDTPFTNDVTPTEYLKYICSGEGSSETFKYVQIPITQNVKNLQNQKLTFTIWSRSNSGPVQLTCQIKQFFGDGTAPSSPVNIPISNFNLIGTWQKFTKQVTIPSIGGNIIGECGNDGLFLQIQYPLDVTCNIDIAKPSLYLGDIAPDEDYQTFDQINSVIDSPRTGDVRETYNNFSPYGWIKLDDGTIGAPGSSATNRAATDTFPLYNLIWNSIDRNSCPVVGGAGANAVSDFLALKPIFLPKNLGRSSVGTLAVQQLFNFTADFTTSTLTITSGNLNQIITGSPIFLSTTGTLPAGLTTNFVYYIIVVSPTTFRLASTITNALASINVTFSNNGTPTNTLNYSAYPLGFYEGERERPIPFNSLPNHTHTATSTASNNMIFHGNGFNPSLGFDISVQPSSVTNNFTPQNVNPALSTTVSTTVNPTGNGQPFNLVTPITYRNMIIKL